MTVTLKLLRHAYSAEKLAGQYEFTIDGVTIVTSYAGYVIEFLEYRLFSENRPIEFNASAFQ